MVLSNTLSSRSQSDTLAVVRRMPGLLGQRLSLAGILLLAAFLNVFRLSQQGYGNTYYTAAVKSMLTSRHNFFFASFDPGGFVSVDKPPLGLWIQAVSGKLFGVSGVSVILPQAIAGVLSVAVLYYLVRRAWGVVAGLLAALALALSPISVVTNRTNELDSLLVLTVLLAAWAVIRAAETGRIRWLLLGFVLVGLGFNIKMLQAYLVLPAFYALHFLAPRTGWWRRTGQLAVATIVLVVVSLSWAVAVDLTPAGARPYVGSSSDNSAIDLIIGYNGLDRLLGRGGPGGGARPGGDPPADALPQGFAPPAGLAGGQDGQQAPPEGFRPGGGGPGRAGENGEKGPLRLLNQQLAGQIGWLLPLAVLGFAGAVWQLRPRLRRAELSKLGWRAVRLTHFQTSPGAQSLLLWGMWFVTMAVFFSVAGFFHRYYLVMLAPAVAALCGIGAVALWQLYRRPGLGGWLLPVAIVTTAAVQAQILADYPDWRGRLTPLVLGLGGALALILIVARLWPRPRALRAPALALALGVPALLAAPAVWAGISVWQGGNTNLPAAGPAAGGFGMPGGRGGPGGTEVNQDLLRYLEENRGNATYLMATPSAMQAAPIILATGEPVMAMGGFSGGDPILTADELAQMVKDGVVRFILVGGGRGPGDDGPAIRDGADQQASPEIAAEGARSDGASGGQTTGIGPGQAASTAPGGQVAPFIGPTGGSSEAISWVTQNCTAVPAEAIGGASNQLYDCAAASQ